MYTKRIQLVNYGPIDQLDIAFPFEGDTPKPVVLVGENGSGKSILLSHIVNGLISAKGVAYPETPEVETGKVYKIRGASYIRSKSDYYFGRVDFENGLFVEEMVSRNLRREYEVVPTGISGTVAQDMWENMRPETNDHYNSSFFLNNEDKESIEDIFSKNCVLYFPPNRFEEPAWLNEENLKARAQYMALRHMWGQTDRKVIDHSPLHANQNWLFDVIYDRNVFEVQEYNFPLSIDDTPVPPPVLIRHPGNATSVYNSALQIAQSITKRQDARFEIGKRRYRVVSLESDTGQLVPNIFQLSSGETSLLNLFLSILRDFDLTGTPFSGTGDIRGIVIVDEIDLHLHAIHQHDILPMLIRMFPKIQFLITTHSPLFVLGMNKVFGEDGFALYRLSQGQQISPEEFSEFGSAYQSFTETRRFTDDIRTAIERSKKPIVLLEGTTDQKYLLKASSLLGKESVIQSFEVCDGGGSGNLSNIWRNFKYPLTEIIPQKVLLLFDCDKRKPNENKGNLFQRTIPFQADNPVKDGIENLFGRLTLDMARRYNPAFVDISEEHIRVERGESKTIAEHWTVNKDEKTNLCDWLCENGTQDDFQGFGVVLDILEELLDLTPAPLEGDITTEFDKPGLLPGADVVANPPETP